MGIVELWILKFWKGSYFLFFLELWWLVEKVLIVVI